MANTMPAWMQQFQASKLPKRVGPKVPVTKAPSLPGGTTPPVTDPWGSTPPAGSFTPTFNRPGTTTTTPATTWATNNPVVPVQAKTMEEILAERAAQRAAANRRPTWYTGVGPQQEGANPPVIWATNNPVVPAPGGMSPEEWIRQNSNRPPAYEGPGYAPGSSMYDMNRAAAETARTLDYSTLPLAAGAGAGGNGAKDWWGNYVGGGDGGGGSNYLPNWYTRLISYNANNQ